MKAWVLGGPTASGKTAVAHLIAKEWNAVVLCADAMAVYRGLDIGTAKPDRTMRAAVSYFGIDLVDPCQTFSAGEFVRAARDAAEEASRQGRPLIVVGGSGLYISAVVLGLDAPPSDPAKRAEWEILYRDGGVEKLQAALQALDPHAFESLSDPRNPRRLIRALERAASGQPSPRAWAVRGGLSPICVLRRNPVDLRARIWFRAREMVENGLIEEARRLRAEYPGLSATARHAIGYAEAYSVLDGQLSEEEAIQAIARRTWRLARRQMTWFRHQLPATWIDIHPEESPEAVADRVRRAWEEHGPVDLHV